MSCSIKVNSNTIELAVHTSCYCVLDLLCVTNCIRPRSNCISNVGGPEIKIWDLLAGGRLLTTMSPHNKTVTSLGFASRGTRLMSSSLDRQVKFHNLSTFKTVHSVSFPAPVLTAAVSVGFLPDKKMVT